MLLENLFLRVFEDWAGLTDAHAAKLLTDSDGFLDALACNEGTNDTTGKSVTGSICVDNVLDLGGGKRLGLGAPGDGQGGWLSTVGDDDSSRSGELRRGVGNGLCNLREVLGAEAVRLGVGLGLRLVTEDNLR